MATGSVVPHPPPGPRPDYLPRYRAGTRYVRRDSLPPLERGLDGLSGISRVTKPTSGSSEEKSSKGPIPARHTAKSRARAAFLEEERAKFDEKYPPLRRDAPPHAVIAEKPLVKRPEPYVETPHDDQNENHCVASANQLSTINPSKPITPSNSAITHVSSTGMLSGVNYYTRDAVEEERKQHAERDEFAMLVARRQEEYARMIAEREEYAEANGEIMELIKEYETFLSYHPAQLAEIKRRISVDVKDAEKARRQGDYKREFAIRKAHLQDLFYNKAQVVTLLKKQEEERKKIEESVQAEIDKIKQNEEMVIEQKVKLLKEMLHEEFPSDDDESYEDSSDEEEEECNCDREDCDCSESDYDEEHTENNKEEEEPIVDDDDEGKCDVESCDDDMDYDGDGSDCEDDEDNVTMKGSIHTSLPLCSQTVSENPVTSYGQSTPMENENPICDEVCHLCKQQTIICSSPTECCTPTDSETLEDLAIEVEGDILESLAKLGRLLNLEMAHNGNNDTEMLDRVESLLTMMEMIHKNKGEISIGTEECCDGKGSEENKPTELVEETSTPDLHVDDPEDDGGPILPAFTSTSINTSYAESKPSVDALRSNSSTEDRAMKSESNKSSSVVVTAEQTNPMNVKNGSMGTSRSGKKQVSFVQEVHNQNAKPHKSNSTFYARMSINEMAELVSSALMSQIMSFTDMESGCENEHTENDTNQPSAIAVKYVLIITTEKNENTLKPVFARNHENKQNTLAFSITGEILLSSSTNEVIRDSSKDCSPVAWDGNMNVNEGMSPTASAKVASVQFEDLKVPQLSTEQTVTTEGVENQDRSYGSVSDVPNEISCSFTDTVPKDTCSRLDSRSMENSAASTKSEFETSKDSKRDSTSAMEIPSQCTSSAVECSIRTKLASENNEKTPVHSSPQVFVPQMTLDQQNSMAFEMVDSTGLQVDAIITPTCKMVPLIVAKDGENSEGNTGKALVLYNPQILNPLCTQTAPDSKNCQTVNSGGKQTSESTTDTQTNMVTSFSGASEQRMLIVHPQILKPHTSEFPKRMILVPTNTDSEPNESAGSDNSGSQTNNLCEMTATHSATGEKDTDHEMALVPFNSQIVTLKILSINNNSAEPPVTPVSENSEDVDREGAQIIQMDKQTTSIPATDTENTENALVPFDSQIITLKTFNPVEEPLTVIEDEKSPEDNGRKVGCESSHIQCDMPTALPASIEEKVENALVPFDSQIITLKAFPNVAELTELDSAPAAQMTIAVESDDTKPNLESENVAELTELDSAPAAQMTNAVESNEMKPNLESKNVAELTELDSAPTAQMTNAVESDDSKPTLESENVAELTELDSVPTAQMTNAVESDETKPNLESENVVELTEPDSVPTAQMTNAVESDETNPNLESENDPPCTVTTAISNNDSNNTDNSHLIQPEKEISGHQIVGTEIVTEKSKTNGRDWVDSLPLNSSVPKTHKSLPSFRTVDLEEAVSGKRCEQKLGLRWTRSRPVILPMEPRTPLLPRRPKRVDTFRSQGSSGDKTRSRTMDQGFYQSIPQRETQSETFEKLTSGVKCSKSFHSQPTLIATDMTLLYSPHPSKTTEVSRSGIGHLDGAQVSEGSVKCGKTDSSNLTTPNEVPARAALKSEKLRKLHSLPPIFRKDGHRFTYEELKRSQSYNTSADNVPKLPKL